MRVRDRFFTDIYQYTRNGADVVICSSDLGAPSLDDFRRDFGNRFINVGIAEQNLISVAAGLQLTGKHVIGYSLNPFPVTRAYDQMRNILSSLRIPITVTALHAGTSNAEAGFTHLPIENISMMRNLRGVQIVNPTDEIIASRLADEVIKNPYPRYVQFDKELGDSIYEKDKIDFSKGFVTNKFESDTIVIAYGYLARKCMRVIDNAKVIDCFSLPVDDEPFVAEINHAKTIVTLDDGIITGGLGSMVMEIMNDYHIYAKLIRKGLQLKNGYPHQFMNRKTLLKSEGVDFENLNDLLKGTEGEIDG